MDKIIEKFLRRHHLLSLAVQDTSGIWCANLFYVYNDCELIFFSSPATRHIKSAQANSHVACTIATSNKIVAKLRGVQIEGILKPAPKAVYRPIFLKKFPAAAFWDEELWVVEITTVKYTDNTLGFGKKLYWDRNSSPE